MSDIFISHNSADNAVSEEIFVRLKDQGHRSLYLDFDPEQGIPAGRDWEQDLYRELRACQALLVLCSEHSMNSKWCFAEITHAKALGKPVIPVKIAPCEISPLLTSRQVIDWVANPEEGYERLWRGLSAAGIDPRDSFYWDSSRSPYPGLRYFEEEDAAVFFGRQAEVQRGMEMLQRVRRYEGAQIVLVLGPSGIGKSSLVRAGILPRCRRDNDHWLVIGPFRPGESLLHGFAMSLAQVLRGSGEQADWREIVRKIEQGESRDNQTALRIILDEIRRKLGRPEVTALLVIDQAEELLDASSDDADFLQQLNAELKSRDASLVGLFTMRTDMLNRFQEHAVVRNLTMADLRIGPLSDEGVVEVIEGPARVAGMVIDEGLVQAMVADSQTKDSLPLLAFTLRQLYERHGEDKHLELSEYRDELGGMAGAIARAADAVLAAEDLSETQMADLRRAFLALARINESGEFIRRKARLTDLPSSTHPILRRFANEHLLIISSDRDDAGTTDNVEGQTVEVAHEALLRSWRRLTRWLDEDREFLLWHRRFEDQFTDWEKVGRKGNTLLTGLALNEAVDWLDRRDTQLTQSELEFIRVSEKDTQSKHRTRQITYSVLGALLLLLAGSLFWLKNEADVTRTAIQARDSTLLGVLARSELFTLDTILDGEDVPGAVQALDEGVWTSLVKADGDVVLARPYGNRTPGRIVATGHSGFLTSGSSPSEMMFPRMTMLWLQGDRDPVVAFSEGHHEALAIYNDRQARIERRLRDWNYGVRVVPNLADYDRFKDVSVLIVGNAWTDLGPEEMDAIERYVEDGGGLMAVGIGWSWQDYGPDGFQNETRLDIRDYPMNKLMERFGMRWLERPIARPQR